MAERSFNDAPLRCPKARFCPFLLLSGIEKTMLGTLLLFLSVKGPLLSKLRETALGTSKHKCEAGFYPKLVLRGIVTVLDAFLWHLWMRRLYPVTLQPNLSRNI